MEKNVTSFRGFHHFWIVKFGRNGLPGKPWLTSAGLRWKNRVNSSGVWKVLLHPDWWDANERRRPHLRHCRTYVEHATWWWPRGYCSYLYILSLGAVSTNIVGSWWFLMVHDNKRIQNIRYSLGILGDSTQLGIQMFTELSYVWSFRATWRPCTGPSIRHYQSGKSGHGRIQRDWNGAKSSAQCLFYHLVI